MLFSAGIFHGADSSFSSDCGLASGPAEKLFNLSHPTLGRKNPWGAVNFAGLAFADQ